MTTEPPAASRPRRQINFEISVRRQRRWQVFATYSANERDLALADAEKFEKDGSDGAKVTKETYNLDTNQVETAVIYRSPALEKEMIELAASRPRTDPPVKRKAKSAAPKPAAKPAPKTSTPAKSRKRQSSGDDNMMRAVPWIMTALVVSCLVGGAVTVGASYSIQYAVAAGIAITRQTQFAVLAGVFVIITGTVSFPQLRRTMRRFGLTGKAKPSATGDAAPTPQAGVSQVPEPTAPSVAPSQATVISAPTAPAIAPATAAAVHQAQSFEAAMANGLGTDLTFFDTAQRFAANVYVGGAMDHLAGCHDMDRHACRDLYAGALARLGAPAEMSARLPDLLEGYLGQPKVRTLYEAGATHMAAHLAGQPFDVAACLADWDAATAPEGNTGDKVVAVLFTEVVEPADAAPDAAPDAADKAASRRMLAHDHIVGRALEACDGVEIKHTDDGIMASFANPANAVEAAALIIGNVADNAAENAGRGFDVRIGIDAGTVVQQGAEVFGATVQLASRLCDSCADGEILVSRAIRDLSGGKHEFRQLEDMSLKGFPEPVPVCRVMPAGDTAVRTPSVARAG